jgi:RecA-family ATPase
MITNGIERDDFYGITIHHVTREDYSPYTERPPFLVDGVLHSTMTLLYGEAKIGKSTLAAALTVATANGESDFLGRKITTGKPARVGIIAGDFGDDAAYGDQLRGELSPGAAVSVYGLDRPPGRRVWEGLQLKARENRHNVIIVDNLTSFVNGSLSDDVAVSSFFDQLDVFVRDGMAVLVVAHTSEKPGENGYKSPYPMGSSAIRARARWLWRVQSVRGSDNIKRSYSPGEAGSDEGC